MAMLNNQRVNQLSYRFNGHFRNRLRTEVPTIYVWPIFQAYVRGYAPQNMAKHMVLTYLHVLDPGMTIDPLVICYIAMEAMAHRNSRTYSKW